MTVLRVDLFRRPDGAENNPPPDANAKPGFSVQKAYQPPQVLPFVLATNVRIEQRFRFAAAPAQFGGARFASNLLAAFGGR